MGMGYEKDSETSTSAWDTKRLRFMTYWLSRSRPWLECSCIPYSTFGNFPLCGWSTVGFQSTIHLWRAIWHPSMFMILVQASSYHSLSLSLVQLIHMLQEDVVLWSMKKQRYWRAWIPDYTSFRFNPAIHKKMSSRMVRCIMSDSDLGTEAFEKWTILLGGAYNAPINPVAHPLDIRLLLITTTWEILRNIPKRDSKMSALQLDAHYCSHNDTILIY